MAFITTNIDIRGEKRPYYWVITGTQWDLVKYGKVAIASLSCYLSPQQYKSDECGRNRIWSEESSFESTEMELSAQEVKAVLQNACLQTDRFQSAIVDTIGDNWTEENWKEFVNSGNLPIFNV